MSNLTVLLATVFNQWKKWE